MRKQPTPEVLEALKTEILKVKDLALECCTDASLDKSFENGFYFAVLYLSMEIVEKIATPILNLDTDKTSRGVLADIAVYAEEAHILMHSLLENGSTHCSELDELHEQLHKAVAKREVQILLRRLKKFANRGETTS